MLDGLLKDQIRGDGCIAGMLTTYSGVPAFFYQKSPMDTDEGWEKPCYPRMDYGIDMRYDPERKNSGALTVNIWCVDGNAAMPEDIEMQLVELVNGTFYTPSGSDTVCAVWNRSESFSFNSPFEAKQDSPPEGFGMTVSFDLMAFPCQMTTDPDPIQGLNNWTKCNFPGMTVIDVDGMPEIWKPSVENPAIYWRFDGPSANDRQSYAVNWYTGQFFAHVITGEVTGRNRWIKAMTELIQIDGEVLLVDGSPLFAERIVIRQGADPLREGQFTLTGRYGVLAQHRRERTQVPLNRANFWFTDADD
ncbi:MAG: hypothetical protein FWE80_01910 [Oscillospiraceae bacterium]|nr:hypothetical protein [Oscillospiraceae bacterium]